MIQFVRKDYEHRTLKQTKIRDAFKDKFDDKPPAVSTIKYAFNHARYHKCRACQKSYLRKDNIQKRLLFCLMHYRCDVKWWKQVGFTDESYFCKNARHMEWPIRTNKERYCTDYIQFNKRGKASTLYVWAMVGQNSKLDLVFYGDWSGYLDEAWEKEHQAMEGDMLEDIAIWPEPANTQET